MNVNTTPVNTTPVNSTPVNSMSVSYEGIRLVGQLQCLVAWCKKAGVGGVLQAVGAEEVVDQLMMHLLFPEV